MRHLDLGALQRNCLPKLELHRPCWEGHLEFHHSDWKWELFLRLWTQSGVWFLTIAHYRQINQCFLLLWESITYRSVRFCNTGSVLHGTLFLAFQENISTDGGNRNDFFRLLGDWFKSLALLSWRSMLFSSKFDGNINLASNCSLVENCNLNFTRSVCMLRNNHHRNCRGSSPIYAH